jgi:arsenate reductase
MALILLGEKGFPTASLRSKSWDSFAEPGAPRLDFIFTVCDNAAGETCPIWPGHPMTAHWGIEDPAAVEGPGQRQAFERAFDSLERRISHLLALPIDTLDPASLQARLRGIGETHHA